LLPFQVANIVSAVCWQHCYWELTLLLKNRR